MYTPAPTDKDITQDLFQDRPLQYSTSYRPLLRVTRILKSCCEMHLKACQQHKIISVLSKLWASRSWYKLGQLKATRILRQHMGIAEVLQSCLICLLQAHCTDFRGGSSWVVHVRVVLLSPDHSSLQSQPKQPPWLPDQDFCLHSKNLDLVAEVKRNHHCSHRWEKFCKKHLERGQMFQRPPWPPANKLKHPHPPVLRFAKPF